MPTGAIIDRASLPVAAGRFGHRRRFLLLVVVSALGLGAAVDPSAAPSTLEPDLVRLLRFMALLKGVFAVLAIGICYWRLARPAALWREIVYVAGPGLMAGGALCLWRLQSAGLAAAGLHLGMLALLAAALTDSGFIPTLRRRSP